MKKKILFKLIILENLLYFALIIFVSSGKLDSLLLPLPVVIISIGVFISSVLFILLLLAKYNYTVLTNTRTLFLLSLMVIIAVHITLTDTKPSTYPNSPLFSFYYIIIIIYATLGNGILWLGSFSLFLVSEFGTLFLESITIIQKTKDYKLLFDKILFMIPETVSVFITGIVCYFVSKIGSINTIQSKKHKNNSILQNRENNNSVKNPTSSNTQIPNTSPMNKQPKMPVSITINENELSSVVFFMSKYFRAYSSLGFIYNNQKKIFKLNAYHSRSMSIIKNIEIPAGVGIIGNLAFEQNTFLSGNLKNYDVDINYYSTNETINSILAVPILSSNNELLGALVVDSIDKLAFRDTQKEILNRFSYLAAALINNVRMRIHEKRIAEQFEMLAKTDGLTQLCNHRTFQDYLSKEIVRSQRYNRSVSLLLMDIDHFKKFNDTYGHQTGDLVLQEVARTLSGSVRTNDIPARYGGEEFAVILPETPPDKASLIGERIRRKIELTVINDGKQNLRVTVSIGCSTIPDHTKNKQEIINFADTAMYYSKKQGRNKFTLYSKKI